MICILHTMRRRMSGGHLAKHTNYLKFITRSCQRVDIIVVVEITQPTVVEVVSINSIYILCADECPVDIWRSIQIT